MSKLREGLLAEIDRLRAQLSATEQSRQAMMALLDAERLDNERLRTTIEFGNDLVESLRAELARLNVHEPNSETNDDPQAS